MNSTNKNISKQELLGCDELINFKNFIECKYSPNTIQNDCLIKYSESHENKLIIEFTFNQKYGTDYIDFIYEPILVYQKPISPSNTSTNIFDINLFDLSPLLFSDDFVELIFNEKTIESISFSTLIAKLKINKKQIINIDSKYFMPLELGILTSGFVVNSENINTLRVKFTIKKFPTRQVNLSDYYGFQLKYKSFITPKLKIKNSIRTTKLLNEYFSHPSNKKLLSVDLEPKLKISNEFTTQSTQSTQSAQSAQSAQSSQFVQSAQSAQSIPVYRSTMKNQEHYSLNMSNYPNMIGTLYNEIGKCYDYDNIQPFNSLSIGDGISNGFQSLIDYELNDEIDEYKKIDDVNDIIQYYQNEKFFNKKITLIYDMVKEINNVGILDKSISFQATPTSNFYFYFSNYLNENNHTNLFDSIRLKLNGKTIYEAERVILSFNVNNDNIYGLYLIPNNSFSSKSNSVDNYELIFDGLTQSLNLLNIKIFESSKYLSIYSNSNQSPNIIKI